jgi:uncharacterized protein (TIGR02145 family)
MISSWIASITVVLALAPGQPPSKRMADGKVWTTRNVDVDVAPSYCYDDAEANCLRYGRLYTWESARRACQALGDAWRLPTNDEWRALATAYGGLREETADKGRAAYDALIAGGRSGFEAVFGGGRSQDGQYARGDAHGFYWTASETGPATAWFYNLGRGGLAVNRHADGEKPSAFAVRCIGD